MRADYSLKMLASDVLLLKLMVMMLMISLASSTRQQSDSDRVSQGRKCLPGQFHQVSSGTCQVCSDCPLNQIIRKPCSDEVDTTCSPFYEFENFHQGSDDIDEEDENNLGLNEDDEKTATGLWSTHPLKSKSAESAVKDDNAAAEESPLQQRTDVAEVITPQAEGPSVESDVLRWKQLCFGLIGALAVITFIAFLYILLTQLYARRHPGKTIAIADPDDPAICYRTRVFSRERLNTSDYKVNLDHLEADSETHHGKKWLLWRLFHPRSHRHYGRVYEVDSHGLFPLQIIPNRGAMMDGDHLDVPEVHIMGSTDSGFSAETQSNVPI